MKPRFRLRQSPATFAILLTATLASAQTTPPTTPPAAPDITNILGMLNVQFALPSRTTTPQLQFIAGEGGLICADINTSAATGRVYLLGGHVTAWQPVGQQPVIFMSSATPFAIGKAIRGGVPVCFPWFAGKSEGAVAGVGGPDGPFHGTVRTIQWQVEQTRDLGDGTVQITLGTQSDATSKLSWPGDYQLHEQVTFGKQFAIELQVKNTGTAPMKYEEALHYYLFTKDARQASVLGLDGVDYIDKVDAKKQKHQTGTITFPSETDRIYMNTKSPLTLVDDSLSRRITVEKSNSNDTVIWSPGTTKVVTDLGPGQGTSYVAIETANLNGNAPTAQPGETQSMGFRLTVGK